MKTIFYILLLVLNFATYRAQIKVKIKFKHQRAACGGVRIDESNPDFYRFAMPGQTLYIKQGEVNDLKAIPVQTVVTDKQGVAEFKLPKGTYAVILSQKMDSVDYNRFKNAYKVETEFYTSMDTACLNKWLLTPDLILKVDKKSPQKYDLITYGNCYNTPPCVNFIGPSLPKRSTIQSR